MGYFVINNFKLKLIDLSDDTNIAGGGGTNTQTLKPDPGFVYEIIHIDCNIPAIAAATGNHTLRLYYQNGTYEANMIYMSGTDGSLMSIGGYYGLAASSELPNSHSTQQPLISGKNMYVSNTNYMEILYTNSSDTAQAGTRRLLFYVKEYKEA